MKTPLQLWHEINRAGGINAYISSELERQGFLVERQDTLSMSKSALTRYKKELKREAAEKAKIRKLAWEAYKASHIVHLGENIFWNDCNDSDKYDCKDSDIRLADNELPTMKTPDDLAEALGITMSELRWLSYHREVAEQIHYYNFTIPKRDGSQRQIWAPMSKLKSAQRWILLNIVEKLPVHGAAHGFVPGRSTLSNALPHTNPELLIKIDIKDFFPTVTFPRVKGIFRKAGYSEQLATLLALICTEAPREELMYKGKKLFVSLGDRALPQGAPTSPALTNALFLRVDRRIEGLADKLGLRYTRYADDLTFSLPADGKTKSADFKSGKLVGLIKRILHDEGFDMHPSKTKVLTRKSCQRVTGLVVSEKGAPRVPRELRRKVRAAIHTLSQGKELKEGQTIESVQGYISYISMTDKELGKKLQEQFTAVS